jgi:hypothetical protein
MTKNNKPRGVEVLIPRQHVISGLLCRHMVVDSRGYFVCIRNVECPAYCLPENCVYLKGVLEHEFERDC